MTWLAAGAACLLAAAPAAAASGDGRSADDLALEEFLATAEVVASAPLGSGVTGSHRLTLRRDGVERWAVFKTVDIHSTEVYRTDRFEIAFSDSYLYEAAAYRVDRLLGLRLVPVTVLREVDGQRGSLQAWVDDVVTLRQLLAEPAAATGDVAELRRSLTGMFVLDALIANVDRTWDNVLINPRASRFALIDHSRSFRLRRTVEPPIPANGVVPLAPALAARFVALDEAAFATALDELLSRAQLHSLVKRHGSLVAVLGEAGLLPAGAA